MRSNDPWDLLGMITTLVHVADSDLGEDAEPPVDLDLLVEALSGFDVAETTAALSVMRVLVVDDLLRVQIAKELGRRTQPMPLWIRDIDETRVTHAAVMKAEDGVADNIVLGIEWAGGAGASSYVVLVHHGLGSVAKDGFPLPTTFDETMSHYRELSEGQRTQFLDLPLGDARGFIEDALDNLDVLDLDFTEETWPASRPALEWFLELMPEPSDDFLGYELASDDLDDFELDELDDLDDLGELDDLDELDGMLEVMVERATAAAGFAASEGAAEAGLDLAGDGPDTQALRLVVALGTVEPEEEPAAWTPERVTTLMTEVLPGEALLDRATAERFPLVFGEFVAWELAGLGMPKTRTAKVRRTIDQLTPRFLDVVTSPEAAQLRSAIVAYQARAGLVDLGMIIVEPGGDDATS
jgi:hypothetical protein